MIYQFKCEKCGELELNLRMSEIPLKECPNCGCAKIERIFSGVTSIWKTTGAYSKQYHRKDNS